MSGSEKLCKKTWRFRPLDLAVAESLERQCELSLPAAQLLQARGFQSAEQVRNFLVGKLTDLREPALLPGVVSAAEQLLQAIQAGDRLVVHGDYDADGMTATAILFRCLKLLGGNVGYHIPCRMEDGYGLQLETVRKLASEGARWIITVDCGIASIEEAQLARELGVQLIVTDHHTPGPRLPHAAAIVHPALPGESYPFAGLCGAAVAFKLAWRLCQQYAGREDGRVLSHHQTFLLQALGLAALGTIADVVPLLDENRLLVRHGLPRLLTYPVPGLAELLKLTGLADKQALQTDDIGFTLAPRLNAAGRLGQAQLAVELLVTENQERAATLAQYLSELNGSRDTLERSIMLAAAKQCKERFNPEQDRALVLAERGWHPGVIGLVAGRLAEKHHCPVVVIALDELAIKSGVGSARGVEGLNLYEALAACQERLEGFGGHAAAAGLRIQEDQVDAFRQDFAEYVRAHWRSDAAGPELWIDVEVPFAALSVKLVQQLEELGPFGHSHPRPVYSTSRVTLTAPPKRIGGGERHLTLTVAQGGLTLRGVAFGAGERFEEFADLERQWDLAYRPVINEFRGRKSLELQILDWRKSGS